MISSNDPYAGEAFSLNLAKAWGLEVVQLGRCGHINDQSGYGDWPEGMLLLERFLEGLARPRIRGRP